MQIVLYLVMLVLFFGVMIAVGFVCRRKSRTSQGFMLGGRSVGPWLTAFAYGTSYFSAVVFVGYAGQFGWKFGVSSTWIGLGNALLGSLLAWVVLGRRTRVMTQHLKSSTMSDFFAKRYFSPALKIAAAVIIVIFLIPYTASLYNGLSRLFEMAFHIDFWICIVIMAYSPQCTSLRAAIRRPPSTISSKASSCSWASWRSSRRSIVNGGGWEQIFADLSQVPADNGSEQLGVFTSFFGPDILSLLSVVILTSLGTWGLPQMVQKFYAIKDEQAIKKGTLTPRSLRSSCLAGATSSADFPASIPKRSPRAAMMRSSPRWSPNFHPSSSGSSSSSCSRRPCRRSPRLRWRLPQALPSTSSRPRLGAGISL